MRGKEIKLVVKSQMQNITKHTNKNRTKADQNEQNIQISVIQRQIT